MRVKDLQLKWALRSILLVLLLGVVGMGRMSAQSFTVGNLNYSVNDDGVSVTLTGHVDGQDATGELVISEAVTYEGTSYPVTTIGGWAFSGCYGLTGDLVIPNSVNVIGNDAFFNCGGFTGSLTIGNSVTSIGEVAFCQCSGLTGNLTIGNSVTSIGNNAFYYCIGFTGSLTIGNSVTSIGDCALHTCSDIDSIVVDSGNTFYDSRENCNALIETGTNNLILGCKNSIIPNTVTSIGESAFALCNGLTDDLVIPNSVTEIGGTAFWNCYGLTGNLTIGNSVTTIGRGAFGGCGFTGNLVIPNSVTTIDEMTFFSCVGFTGDLVIPNSVTTIGGNAFWGCSGFTGALVIPNSVTVIGDYAFTYCSGFTGNLVIPNSVTEIGGGAFSGCSGFTGSLTIGNSVTTIGESAFNDCSGFTGDLVIPNSVTTIGDYAFTYCSGFTGDLVIPNSVDSIGFMAFSVCSVESVVVDSGNTFFDSRENCNAIIESSTNNLIYGCKNSIIPNSVTTIGDYAFWGCSGLTGDLIIPNSVNTIGNSAFAFCSGFTGSLTIGNSVTTIGDGAFHGCRGISEIHSKNMPPPFLGLSVFQLEPYVPVYVPCGAAEAYASDSGWSFFTYHREEFVDLNVMVNDDSLGEVSILILGNCENPECTVLAEPYPGSMFVNWTINEVEVSTDAEYTFLALEDMELTANFALASSVSEDSDDDNAPFAFISNGNIVIIDANAHAVLQIVDMTGRVVRSTDGACTASTSGIAPGVYVLRLINGDVVRTQKIVID